MTRSAFAFTCLLGILNLLCIDSFSNWSLLRIQHQQQRRCTTSSSYSRIDTNDSQQQHHNDAATDVDDDVDDNDNDDDDDDDGDNDNINRMKVKNHINNQYSKTRRKILQQITTSATITTTVLVAPSCFLSKSNNGHNNEALAAQTAGEAIRKSAANIPGYGQPDVYYPPSFLGKWRATRVILAIARDETTSDSPLSILSSLSSSPLPITLYYDVRFITVDGDDVVNTVNVNSSNRSNNNSETEKVIADRQFNEASYYNALRAEIVKQTETATTSKVNIQPLPPPSIQSITWSPFNPNVCTSIYNDGSMQEIKVTKRAAELDLGNGNGTSSKNNANANANANDIGNANEKERMTLISSSEYRRVTTTKGAMGIPSIAASRVLTKWKSEVLGVGLQQQQSQSKNQIVEGIEIVYSDGMMGGGDPLAGGVGGGKPMLSSKSRLKLERL